MRFDWYSASVPASVPHLISSMISNFGGEFEENVKRQKSYEFGQRHSETLALLSHGGKNPLPHIEFTGSSAPAGAEFLRRVYPFHRVARADICEDFREDGGFDRMKRVLDPIARHAGVKPSFVGDPEENDPNYPDHLRKGRTWYYGSVHSDVRVTLYEKGLEQRSVHGVEDAPLDWYRVELRVKPRKVRKSIAATSEPDALWGFAKWTSVALREIGGVSPVYCPDVSMRKSETEKAVNHMVRQYARAMRAFVEKYGRESLDQLITDTIKNE